MIQVQIKGDITQDPTWWTTRIRDKLNSETGAGWQVGALGEQPGPRCLAPTPDADGLWDGGVMISATTPELAQRAAMLLNHFCIAGASGTHRVDVTIRRGLSGDVDANRRPGNGSRRGRGNGRPPARMRI